jgi:hypothetical protein
MKMSSHFLATLCGFALAAASARAQFYKLHNADIGGGAIGQFTESLPAQNASSIEDTTHNSFGGMFSLRDYPVAWMGLELNYAYTEYGRNIINEQAVGGYNQYVHNDQHEATAAYLIHPHLHYRSVKPFVALGGGYIDFVPSYAGSNQWRGTGLVEVGLEIPTSNPHFGFRLEGRELVYRHPDFNQSNLASRTWAATSEPMFGVWYRF